MSQNARSKNETNRAEDIEEKVVEDGKKARGSDMEKENNVN
jgi:hypothetical protein